MRGATASSAGRATRMRACFNPRPRAGGDSGLPEAARKSWSFNPRPRAGGDAARILRSTTARAFQSAPPCGGRPTGPIKAFRTEVSIRAPVRGATPLPRSGHQGRTFQSAPPCGGRLTMLGVGPPGTSFNPRPRAGGDSWPRSPSGRGCRGFNPRPRAGGDAALRARPHIHDVSIRAPVRGATLPPEVTC